jgi:OOP family OmpA-OmpF porin
MLTGTPSSRLHRTFLKALPLLLVGALLAPSKSYAGGAFDLQLFRPAVDSKGYVTVNASQILGHLDWSIGLVGSYERNAFQIGTGKNGPAHFGVSDYFTPQLQAAVGFFKWFEVGLSLPLSIEGGGRQPSFNSPASGDTDGNHANRFSAQFLGDVGIHVKARFLNTSKYPVGLGLLFSIYTPSGKSSNDTSDPAFLGEGQVTLRPELIVDREWGRSRRWKTALNFGALIRPHTNTFTDQGTLYQDSLLNSDNAFCTPTNTSVLGMPNYANAGSAACGTQGVRKLGDQLTFSIGTSYAIVPNKFELIGEFYGYADVQTAHQYAKYNNPLEGLAAAKVYMARNSYFQLGGGAGVLQGALSPSSIKNTGNMVGSPQWRVFIGFIFEPSIGDRDGDGIKDDIDKCPDDPEDMDDFEDEDGCPDPDNDRDGILDKDDKCPNEPETKNGFEDEDGCPDSLDTDRDGDGIPDRVDKCPDDPEDKDGFEDEDGCPDPDNDKDGIPDVDDLCPNDPEDMDGFEDKDGCPDPDNDKDRILDKDDKCPNQPETYNGFEDEDGCPDKSRVLIKKGKLLVLDKIYFETAKAVIKPMSFPILDAIAATLKGNPQILLLEVQGHADERGNDDYNMRLTEDRAAAVKTYLTEHGIDADRLQSHGYGETKPALKPDGMPCTAHNEGCWSLNRRVEFIILRQAGEIPGVE